MSDMNDYYFVSYSTKDSKVAHQMVEYLEEKGVKCWIAPENIAAGHDYTDCIDGAIKNSKGIILLYSKYSVMSEWVKKEIARGVSYHKKIVPYKISEAVTDGGINFMLNNVQWIVSMDKPTGKFCEIVNGLSDNAQGSLNNGEGEGGKKNRWMWYVGGAVVVAAVVLLLCLNPKSEDNIVEPVGDTVIETETKKIDTVFVPVENTTEKKKSEGKKTVTETRKDKTKEVVAIPKSEQEEKPSKQPVHEIEVSGNKDTGSIGNVAVQVVPPVEKDNSMELKYKKAIEEYNSKRYKKALAKFEELKKQGASFKDLDSYIEICKSKL